MEPVATPIFFYALAGLAVVSAIAVIVQRNPVHSAVALIFTLLSLAGLYLMLYAPFVAGVQIIVYVGGIMVLFLFVIMLVRIEQVEKEHRFNRQWLVGLATALALGGLMIFVYWKGQAILPSTVQTLPEESNTQQVGLALYGRYMLPFEVASLLLLVAMVGAVLMARKRVEPATQQSGSGAVAVETEREAELVGGRR
jgi:NADH-quinone oxidoreductase subunit J